MFSRREGLLLDPGFPDGFWIHAGITSTWCQFLVFVDHRRVNVKGQFSLRFPVYGAVLGASRAEPNGVRAKL